MRRSHAALIAACVLLAGCSWNGGPAPTPETPQTTISESEEPDQTTTPVSTEAPPTGLVVRNDADDELDVHVRLTDISNETVVHEETRTLSAGDAHYLDHLVREYSQYRVVVSVANASLTQAVFDDERYVVRIENRSSVFGYHVDV